jgi:hypothetical protein
VANTQKRRGTEEAEATAPSEVRVSSGKRLFRLDTHLRTTGERGRVEERAVTETVETIGQHAVSALSPRRQQSRRPQGARGSVGRVLLLCVGD